MGARHTWNTVSGPPVRAGFAVSLGDLDNFAQAVMSACYFFCLLKLKLQYRSAERVREGKLFWSVNLQHGLENVSRASTYKGCVANRCNFSLWPNYPVMDGDAKAKARFESAGAFAVGGLRRCSCWQRRTNGLRKWKRWELLHVCSGGIMFSYPVRFWFPYISLFLGKFGAYIHGVELIKITGWMSLLSAVQF